MCTLQFLEADPSKSALFYGLANQNALSSAQLFSYSGFGLEQVLTPQPMYCRTCFLETDVQILKDYYVKALGILYAFSYLGSDIIRPMSLFSPGQVL